MKLLKKLYLQPLVVILIALLALSSCQPKGADSPNPTEENPSDPVAPKVLLKKISNSPTDFQVFDYDEKGNIIKYTAQNTYRPDGAIQVLTQLFEYDSENRLSKVVSAYGYSKYFYKDRVLEKIENYYTSNNQLLSTSFYTFNQKKQLVETVEVIAKPIEDTPSQIKRTYQYDAKGNMTQQAYLFLNKNNEFELSYTVFYEDYDDKKSIDNLLFMYPYLPDTRFYENNYRRMKTVYPNGAIDEKVYLFDYQYNDKGFPISKAQSIANRPDVISIRFEYAY
ncbi:hypothetical protein [Thermoflexibacter ruber]|uniref:YD repeat-containing protein n=1 Tax=Thermoflexibacter ruber TaxID=1003 RepID=A0A1I2EB63_9BACT|nr:hypothetical protein [Thermoflexibacter ruber]SFE89913.1 hypothetical protein SAMN04488541_100988 [Thermoflexibacter ruber]